MSADAVQALIDEVPGIARGDKVSFWSIMKAQAAHTANLATIAELRKQVEVLNEEFVRSGKHPLVNQDRKLWRNLFHAAEERAEKAKRKLARLELRIWKKLARERYRVADTVDPDDELAHPSGDPLKWRPTWCSTDCGCHPRGMARHERVMTHLRDGSFRVWERRHAALFEEPLKYPGFGMAVQLSERLERWACELSIKLAGGPKP